MSSPSLAPAPPKLSISEDGDHVVISFPPLQPTMMTPEVVDGWIAALGQARACLATKVDSTPPAASLALTAESPDYRVRPASLDGRVVLLLRDVRYGWLHYAFEKSDALRIGQMLVAIGTAPAPAAGRA